MPTKKCSTCGLNLDIKVFTRNASKSGGYNSQCYNCRTDGRGSRSVRSCECCRAAFRASDKQQRYCSLRCASQSIDKSNEKNPNWKGGVTISSKGYVYVRQPEHPRAMPNGYVKRADIVAETMLQRPLRDDEIVHHLGAKNDDTEDKLVVMTIVEHNKLHGLMSRRPRPSNDKRTPPEHSRPSRKIVQWPSAEDLEQMVAGSSLRKVGRMLGCSQVAVLKRLRKNSSKTPMFLDS